jgi:heptosyltransferase-3
MKRILVITTRQIGDVLLTTPLIRAARLRWPEAQVDVLGLEGQLGMLVGNLDVYHRIEIQTRLGLADALRLAVRLWRGYDLALIAEPGDRAHILGWLAAPIRAGLMPGPHRSNWWKRRLLDHQVPLEGDLGATHVVVEKLALLGPWAGSSVSTEMPRVVPPAPRPLPDDLASQLRPGFMVVHAPSMWAYKQWPMESYASVIGQLLKDDHQIVLTGSSSARDRECIAALVGLTPSPSLIDASGRLDFGQLRTLLERSRLYLGPDTSVTHLAAACGTPTVAIFGPTNPQRWAPWPTHAQAPIRIHRSKSGQAVGNVCILQGRGSCVPCGKAGCDDHRDSLSHCLQEIQPGEVLDAIADQLRQGFAPHRDKATASC